MDSMSIAKRRLFVHLPINVGNHFCGIVTAKNILFALFHFKEYAVAPATIVAKIGSNHNVAEISPVAENPPLPHNLKPPAEG
jgi:hypothetical protein